MAMKYDNGRIALWRKFLDWEWYTDVNTKAVFLHLLLTANWRDKGWKGILIKRGQRWASRNTLAQETGLSEQNIRTALEHLKATGEITIKVTSRGMLINIEKYSDYQIQSGGANQQANHQSNQQLTSDQPQLNKDNKENNIYSAEECAKAYEEIVSYLNQKTGKRFKAKTKATQRLINARLKEGYTIPDFKRVIDIKVAQWKGDEAMNKYLQPSTLFGTKFEGYVNENPPQEKSKLTGLKELN